MYIYSFNYTRALNHYEIIQYIYIYIYIYIYQEQRSIYNIKYNFHPSFYVGYVGTCSIRVSHVEKKAKRARGSSNFSLPNKIIIDE